MKCLQCSEEFKQKHKYHVFCSKKCKFRNYFSKDRIETEKIYAPARPKKISEFFDWKEYPYGV